MNHDNMFCPQCGKRTLRWLADVESLEGPYEVRECTWCCNRMAGVRIYRHLSAVAAADYVLVNGTEAVPLADHSFKDPLT